MAVIDGVSGLEVTVEVAGQTATEYEDHHTSSNASSDKSVTRYIESKDDTEFSVTFRINPSYAWEPSHHSLEVRLWIDGDYATGAIFSKHHARSITFYGAERQRSDTTQWYRRKFKFSALKISDHHSLSKDDIKKNRLKKIGTVLVTVTRCVAGKEIPFRNKAAPHDESALEFSEKAMKGSAIAHGMILTREEEISNRQTISVQPLDSDNGPIATFNFLYRSRDALRAGMIIGRTPSPDPTDGMSIEDLRRLARERLEMPVKIEAKVKREWDDTKDSIENRSLFVNVKRSRRESPIDLTDD
ncbi:hypothetical protein Micbo1qcDRAFT_199248 [Microdochium bolleyi]|uniref:DUF7918 domain-containing protein n=1 Tax=Microdochium bolleyi TaxID=196109 RepID=A0A136JH10_9PEZI|nr:hypothetical protein Micbo1qcDRAFT_199248 [Microdochium bolleyi]